MRCLFGIVVLCLMGFSLLMGQENDSSDITGGLHRLTLSLNDDPVVEQALEEFRISRTDDERIGTSGRLLELAQAEMASGNGQRAVQLAKHLFLSSAPGQVRSKAYAILQESVGSQYLAPHVREIVVRVPNVSCYGRFSDWLNSTFRDQHAWIHAVEVKNTDRVGDYAPSDSLIIGTEAELKFIVDRSKSVDDLAKLLVPHASYNWVLLVDRRLDDYQVQ